MLSSSFTHCSARAARCAAPSALVHLPACSRSLLARPSSSLLVPQAQRAALRRASAQVVASQAGTSAPTPRAPKKKSKKLVDINGDVSKDLGNGMFQVKLENGVTVMAHLSGKIRQNRIKIVMGDKVTVELSPYDLTKGRITYRFRPGEYERLQQEANAAQQAAAQEKAAAAANS